MIKDRVVATLGDFVSQYLERVINQRDLSGVDDMVAADYRGSGPGWPTTIADLRIFYANQARTRPDWHIDVRATIELGDSVVVQAHAHGTVTDQSGTATHSLEWLTHYRITDMRITEINVLGIVTRDDR